MEHGKIFFLIQSFGIGFIFSCIISFSDAFSWRILNAFYRPSRKKIKNKWRYILSSRSYCESCQSRIPVPYLLPILGSLLTRFRCFHCSKAVSKRFFWGELLAFVYGFSLAGFHSDAYYILFSMLYFPIGYIIAMIDWEFLLIPTEAILIFMIFSLSEVLIFHDEFVIDLMIAFFWFSLFLLLRILSRYKMGLADVKLIFALSLGLSFPYSAALPTLASLLGIGFYLGKKLSRPEEKISRKLPFGSFLIMGFLILRAL